MKRLTIVALAALLSMALLAGCSGGSEGDTRAAMTTSAYPYPVPTYTSTQALTTSAPGQSWGEISQPERMIVRSGSLTLLVEDISAALDGISRTADGLQGYVVSSQSWRGSGRIYGSISIRVPSESFDSAMSTLASLAVEVTARNTSSEDVTAEYVDLTARLKNLEATERQLLTIMEQATEIDDVLSVQRELTTVREQIEQTKGRMQYLETTSAMSLISVSLEQSSLGLDITASRAVVDQDEELRFTASVFGGFAPFSYQWDFGDGKTSTQDTPTHSYGKSGSYTVSLTVTDDRGNSYTETRDDYITVLTPGGWNIGGVFDGAWQALVVFGKGLLSLGIVLLTFAPVWVPIIVLIWFLRRRRRVAR